MIKATELRIGNWVDSSNGVLYQINKSHFENTDFRITKPIPLTPEILEKCGFLKNGYNYKESDGIIDFFIDKDTSITYYEVGNIVFCNIYYLHELQNLYRWLTGEELKVNL